MLKGLVSVVIPIYNVEKYLNRCIESVVKQTYQNIEIILVDDGSPDNCPQMCDEWAERDSRIRVIHKDNAGLGMARNTGIEAAEGEFICFFDSDDYIENTLIEKAYNAAKDNHAQSVIYGYKCIGYAGNIRETHIPFGSMNVFTGNEVRDLLLLDMIDPVPNESRISNVPMSAWSKLYSMEVIKQTGWRFCSEREYLCEDLYSHLKLYAYINLAVVISEALYNYCDNSESLTKKYRENAPYDSEVCYDAMLDICKKNHYDAALKYRMGFWYFGSIMGICKSVINSDMSSKEKLQEYKKILGSEHFNRIMMTTDFSNEKLQRRILYQIVKKQQYRRLYLVLYLQGKKNKMW